VTGQLVFDFGLPVEGRFDDFWTGGNVQVLARLTQLAPSGRGSFLALWGELGAGKSHLAHALCESFFQQQRSAILVDGQQRAHLHPAMLEGLAEVDLVVIDDIDAFAGDSAWEEALFHLYNQVQQAGTSWVATLQVAPTHSEFRLADLKSRLCACETYRVHALSDTEKREWMRQMARRRGFDLEPECCDYILNRSVRNLPALTHIINTLDAASLAAQRTITLPFIKQVMGW
jgi:DnaA family protein